MRKVTTVELNRTERDIARNAIIQLRGAYEAALLNFRHKESYLDDVELHLEEIGYAMDELRNSGFRFDIETSFFLEIAPVALREAGHDELAEQFEAVTD